MRRAVIVFNIELKEKEIAERGGSVVVSMFAWHAAGRWFDSRTRHVSLLG